MSGESSENMQIKITEGGPYIVHGGVPLVQDAIVEAPDGGGEIYSRVKEYEVEDTYALCRCGRSSNLPFCDGTHAKVGFVGKEVASREPYADRAVEYSGKGVNLLDDNRCAYARFCHVKGVDEWTLTKRSGKSEQAKNAAIQGAWHCPTGRLEAHDAETGEVYEQHFDPSIVILEDVPQGASGPYFVRGGVPLIGADGVEYERRNRYALCRCGNSQDIPFCDAMHINVQFNDGSEAFEGQVGERDTSFKNKMDV